MIDYTDQTETLEYVVNRTDHEILEMLNLVNIPAEQGYMLTLGGTRLG